MQITDQERAVLAIIFVAERVLSGKSSLHPGLNSRNLSDVIDVLDRNWHRESANLLLCLRSKGELRIPKAILIILGKLAAEHGRQAFLKARWVHPKERRMMYFFRLTDSGKRIAEKAARLLGQECADAIESAVIDCREWNRRARRLYGKVAQRARRMISNQSDKARTLRLLIKGGRRNPTS